VGLGVGAYAPKQKYSPPPNEMKPISPFGLWVMFFAFSILYLTSRKSPLLAEIFIRFGRYVTNRHIPIIFDISNGIGIFKLQFF